MLKSFPFPLHYLPQKDTGPVVARTADSTLCWNYLHWCLLRVKGLPDDADTAYFSIVPLDITNPG